MSGKPSGPINTAYVDLASLDKPDEAMYGGDRAITLFSRNMRNYSWYTQITSQDKNNGTNDSPSFTASKIADFQLFSWVETTLPAITVNPANNGQLKWKIAYTWNLAHNIWKAGSLKLNELGVQSYDNVMLDFLAQYRNKAEKWALYQKFIGNTADLQTFGSALPAVTIKLPVPYYYTRDTSYAFPLCACSLNDVKQEFQVETDLTKLIRVQKNTAVDVVNDAPVWVDQKAATVPFSDILVVAGGKPLEVGESRQWSEYVLVTDEERAMHTDNQKDIIIEQFQKFNAKKAGTGEHGSEFHFIMPTKVLMFGVANKTSEDYNNRSNYSDTALTGVKPHDPLKSVTLSYETQSRFENFPPDAFDMQTYRHGAKTITEVGYHAQFYCDDINSLEMTGSSNFSNLVTTLSGEVDEVSGENNTYCLVIRSISANRLTFRNSSGGFRQF